MFGIAVHSELLFADTQSSHFEIFLEYHFGLWNVRQFVSEEAVLLGVLACEGDNRVVSASPSRQPILAAGRKQNCFGDAHRTLVGDQFFVGAAGIVGVLVDINYPLSGSA